MPLDPDTEIQYRKGGKIMKKMPRKFSAGGVPPADVDAAKQDARVKREREAYEKARPTMLGPRPTEKPSEKPPVAKKKGGKVKKFEGGDMVTLDTRERRADERKEPAPIENRTSPDVPKVRDRGDRFLPQTQAEREGQDAIDAAKNAPAGFAAPSSAESQAARDVQMTNEHVNAPGYKPPTAKPAPKVAPKAAPKAASKPQELRFPPKIPKPDENYSNEGRGKGKKDYGERGNMYGRRGSSETGTKYDNPRFTKPETDPSKMSDMDRYFHNKAKKDAAERKARDERLKLESQAATAAKGIAVYKKGGGVEAKGKTKGKIVKMAKGGSVRGYGISKVTNKTKYV